MLAPQPSAQVRRILAYPQDARGNYWRGTCLHQPSETFLHTLAINAPGGKNPQHMAGKQQAAGLQEATQIAPVAAHRNTGGKVEQGAQPSLFVVFLGDQKGNNAPVAGDEQERIEDGKVIAGEDRRPGRRQGTGVPTPPLILLGVANDAAVQGALPEGPVAIPIGGEIGQRRAQD